MSSIDKPVPNITNRQNEGGRLQPLPMDSPETCLNIWCVVDETTGVVYRIAARAYVLKGPKPYKSETLKRLSSTDFHLARDLPVLSKFRSRIVDGAGQKHEVNGLFPSDVNTVFGQILDMVCKELEHEFPTRLVADVYKLRSYEDAVLAPSLITFSRTLSRMQKGIWFHSSMERTAQV